MDMEKQDTVNTNVSENINALSPRQREVWVLREQGVKIKDIADHLGITESAVNQHIHQAKRKFREYERYLAVEERNQEPVSMPLTRGEVKILIKALEAYEHVICKGINYRTGSDHLGKAPYEFNVVADLYDRAQTIVYGEPLHSMEPNWQQNK